MASRRGNRASGDARWVRRTWLLVLLHLGVSRSQAALILGMIKRKELWGAGAREMLGCAVVRT